MIDERFSMINRSNNDEQEQNINIQKDAVIQCYNADTIVEKYEFLDKIGQGSYGMVMKARRKQSGEIVAIKMIQKEVVNFRTEEVELLKKLDHPNIVKLHELFENNKFIFLVMELCECNLIEYFQLKKSGSEKELAIVCTKILSALSYCHKSGFVHRDIKFQNILLGNEKDIRTLKIIDFGLSVNIASEKKLTKALGTAIYLAPEVISGNYNEKADIWSLGVMLYYLIFGSPPFTGKDAQELYMNILVACGVNNLIPQTWIDENPIGDLINKMLIYSPEERYSAEELLKHPWLKADDHSTNPCIKEDVIENIQTYVVKNKFLRILSYQYATRWKDTYCESLKDSFMIIDKNQDGVISEEEFIEAILRFNGNIGEDIFPVDILKMVFYALDSNGNGQIDYTEFQALFSQNDLFNNDKLLLEQFASIDESNDGFIDEDEILRFFENTVGSVTRLTVQNIIKDLDINGDGKIDFHELKNAVKHA